MVAVSELSVFLTLVTVSFAFPRSLKVCPNDAIPLMHGLATVFCGLGPRSQRCPQTHYCNIDPVDRFAVCCPKENTRSALELCPNGASPLTQGLTTVFCGRGPTRQQCPDDHYCNIDPVDRFAVCCPKEKTTPEMCPNGASPLTNGVTTVFCGRGPTRLPCPNDHYCNIDPADRFAVCCPKEKTRATPEMCPNGASPLTNGVTTVFCGRGPTRQPCPDDHYCNIDPADRFAVCCPKEKTRAIDGHCLNGEPPLMQGSVPAFCGLGPFSVQCPSTHYCNAAPDDSYAFCCPRKIITTGDPDTQCPPGKEYVQCFVDPCVQERQLGCPLHPKAECRANYCGGCIPEWWENGKRAYCWAF